MYRDAPATTTPRSTSRARSSIWRGSSEPSAIVTTATGARAASMPKRIALAGPRPYVLSTVRTRASASAILRAYGMVVSSSVSCTSRISLGRCTSRRMRPRQATMELPSL
jgi:hypothetical protein